MQLPLLQRATEGDTYNEQRRVTPPSACLRLRRLQKRKRSVSPKSRPRTCRYESRPDPLERANSNPLVRPTTAINC
jgi:hypothetical protein